MSTQFEQKALEPSGELATAIRDFRAAVAHVADRETARPVAADWLAPARRRRRRSRQAMMLAWACAALLCLAMLPFSFDPHQPAPQPAAAATAATAPAPESASALLEQVDTNVAETVPSPLEPLAELQTWSSESTSAPNTSSRSSTAGSALVPMENH